MRVDTRSVPAHKHTYACASTQTVTRPCTSVSLPTPLPCPSPCLPLTASLSDLTRDPLSAQARDSASGGGVGAARGGVDDRGGVNSRGGVDQSDVPARAGGRGFGRCAGGAADARALNDDDLVSPRKDGRSEEDGEEGMNDKERAIWHANRDMAYAAAMQARTCSCACVLA